MSSQTADDAAARQLTEAVLTTVRVKFEAPEGTTAETPYEEMEFDSLVLLELAVHLSKEYGVEITDDEILNASDITETARLLAGKGARSRD
ncbi:acyl carrier protein [Streptomyces sp. NPDC088124]|uniref:acyl carrier protein n=1 Tax=Streptomyces sp. NPDC088124 TaxID=3154654 RepID=UPI00344211B5